MHLNQVILCTFLSYLVDFFAVFRPVAFLHLEFLGNSVSGFSKLHPVLLWD